MIGNYYTGMWNLISVDVIFFSDKNPGQPANPSGHDMLYSKSVFIALAFMKKKNQERINEQHNRSKYGKKPYFPDGAKNDANYFHRVKLRFIN